MSSVGLRWFSFVQQYLLKIEFVDIFFFFIKSAGFSASSGMLEALLRRGDRRGAVVC